MNKKLNPSDVVSEYERGMSPEDLALKFKVHSSTIRRYLRGEGVILSRLSYPSKLLPSIKESLRDILNNLAIPNPDRVIRELDLNFSINLRNNPFEDFTVIQLRKEGTKKKLRGKKLKNN